MNPAHIKVLLIEGDEDDAILIRGYLAEVENFHFDVTWESDIAMAKKKMVGGGYDIFLIDYRLGSENGVDLVKFIKAMGVVVPSIIMTGQGDIKVDIDASRYGASDYLVKSVLDPSMLERSIRYALSHARIIKELDEKEKKYRALFERSMDPIFLVSDTLGFMDVNASFLNLLHYSYEDGKSLPLENIFTSTADYHQFAASIKEFGQVRDFEVSLCTQSGDSKICLLNCSFIPDQASGFLCYQGIIHDLTQRKQAERDLLSAERLALTGKIARTIAHEVRNPLTNLILALEQLRDELPPDQEAMTLYGEIIERNANRIEKLVDEMLTSSKPKELRLGLTSMRTILDDTVALARDRLNLKQIELKTHYEDDLPRILADRAQVQIALLNIVINAIEAMVPEQGMLTITASTREKILTISIADNGPGIHASEVANLFDPFFTSKESGMGLGLTSTKNILNSHNAQIEVKSELGKGTTFFVHFRLAE